MHACMHVCMYICMYVCFQNVLWLCQTQPAPGLIWLNPFKITASKHTFLQSLTVSYILCIASNQLSGQYERTCWPWIGLRVKSETLCLSNPVKFKQVLTYLTRSVHSPDGNLIPKFRTNKESKSYIKHVKTLLIVVLMVLATVNIMSLLCKTECSFVAADTLIIMNIQKSGDGRSGDLLCQKKDRERTVESCKMLNPSLSYK